jgi:hypothetical protein
MILLAELPGLVMAVEAPALTHLYLWLVTQRQLLLALPLKLGWLEKRLLHRQAL